MKIAALVASLLAAALCTTPSARAQGVPGGAAHGARVGGDTAGPVGAVVGGVVGGVIGGVEGVLGVDRYGYAQPAYAPVRATQERVVVERPRRFRARTRIGRRVVRPHRSVRVMRYRRGYRS